MNYHTKVGIISIILILLFFIISLILSMSGCFSLAYDIYTKSFAILGFIFVGDMVYKWLTYGGKSKRKKEEDSTPATPSKF